MKRLFLTLAWMAIMFNGAGIQAQEVLHVLNPTRLNSAKFSPDGKFVLTTASEPPFEVFQNNADGESAIAKLWETSSGQLVSELKGHKGSIIAAEFTPDGGHVVTASKDRTSKVWEVRTGKLVQTLTGHSSEIKLMAVGLDGEYVATLSGVGSIIISDIKSGKTIQVFQSRASGIIHLDKNYLLARDYNTVFLCDIGSGKMYDIIETGQIRSAEISVDGYIATSEGNVARIWKQENGEFVVKQTFTWHTGLVANAEFSNDGKLVVTASWDKTAKIWDVNNGKMMQDLKHSEGVNSATFSFDGKYVITASSDNTAKVWEVSTGKIVMDLIGHTNAVSFAQFSLDEKYLLTTSRDGSAIIWSTSNDVTSEVTKPNVILDLKAHAGDVNSAKFSPDGKYFVTGSADRTAKIWELSSGKVIHVLKKQSNPGRIRSVTFNANGNHVITASDNYAVDMWDWSNEKIILQSAHDGASSAQVSPDGRYLLTGGYGTTTISNIKGGKTSVIVKIGEYYDHLASQYSPDGKHVVSAYGGYTSQPGAYSTDIKSHGGARIWEAVTGKTILELKGHKALVASACYSSDGKYIVTASEDKTAKVWEAATGNLMLDIKGKHTDGLTAAHFSPDGKFIATASKDKTAKVWEVTSGTMVMNLKGHRGSVNSVQFSPDGKFIITAASDSTVKIWGMSIASKPTSPANLRIKSISFDDKGGNGNSILDADEKAEIRFDLSNTGKGDAYNLVAEIRTLTSVAGLESFPSIKVGTLLAGGTTIVTIPISGGMDIKSGHVEFEIVVREANGFDAEPFKISFDTQEFRNPQLAITDHKFTTEQGGKIKTGQPVSLELILQNRGQGTASSIHVSFNNPLNVFPGTEGDVKIDKLEPNESKILTYEFFANKLYVEKEIPIEVVITEGYGKYGSTRTLKVSVEQTLPKTEIVTISGEAGKAVQIDNVSLKSGVSTAYSGTPETKSDIETAINSNGRPLFYSLIIGVENYKFASPGMTNLNKPVSDANALRSTLLSKYEFPETHSVLLQNPTRSEIIKALEDLARKVTPKDNLLIFYAGHGYWDERLKIGYWLPADAKADDKSEWLSNSVIRDYIGGIQSKHTLLITDACFSGSIFKTRDVTSELDVFAFSKKYRLPSRKAMTSGTLSTVPDESKFMQYLITRLVENSSDFLSASQLFFSLETAVLNNTDTVPQFGVMQDTGDEGGDFIFIRKKE